MIIFSTFKAFLFSLWSNRPAAMICLQRFNGSCGIPRFHRALHLLTRGLSLMTLQHSFLQNHRKILTSRIASDSSSSFSMFIEALG